MKNIFSKTRLFAVLAALPLSLTACDDETTSPQEPADGADTMIGADDGSTAGAVILDGEELNVVDIRLPGAFRACSLASLRPS